MPRPGFEPAISTSEQQKTVLVLDLSAIEIGSSDFHALKYAQGNPFCSEIVFFFRSRSQANK
jgi:hypothetical protein